MFLIFLETVLKDFLQDQLTEMLNLLKQFILQLRNWLAGSFEILAKDAS
jgi:hypothetical protein